MSKRLPCSSRSDRGPLSTHIYHLGVSQTLTGQNTVSVLHTSFSDKTVDMFAAHKRQLEPADLFALGLCDPSLEVSAVFWNGKYAASSVCEQRPKP